MMTNMHFFPKGPAICKISKQMVMKWRNSKQAVLFGVISPIQRYLQNFTADGNEVGKLKTGSAVWGHLSHSKTKHKLKKKVTTEKLSKSGLGRCTKFGDG